MIRIKEIRKSKKITAKQLADVVNVAESTMSLYENGKREPDFTTFIKIAEFLEVSTDYLLGITDQKESPNDKGELSEHETALLNAYRNHLEMQPAVDKLLGIYNEEYVQLYTAASSKDNRPDEFINMHKEKWEKIKNTPDTDDSLM